ncbi:PP0621 family protein [Stutzerimonas balearica]|uniref:PP0621 family protein n=1 Tax=Stutzerimonas balearica TaxID=74829 RepID=UPI0028B16805|nr:PP0621 family protein [Stutzerimonas balearica]
MGLLRLLFWIAIIAAAVWLWRRVFRKPPAGNAQAAEVTMVRCAHCGVHVPQSKALRAADAWYCSQAHLERGRQPGEH